MLSTTSETCERLHVHKNTLYRKVKNGEIPQKYVTRMGRDYRFNARAIERYLLAQDSEPPKNT